MPILIFVLFLAQSCEKVPLPRVYRSQALAYSSHKERQDTLAGAEDARHDTPDTDVFVSAVSVPRDYNWRRDTSYGAVACELMLFKNGVLLYSFNTSDSGNINVSAETHHLIGGHIYTEYSSRDETVICRDGERILCYAGREILRGLLVKDDQIYTLGISREDGGFTYRKNGEIVLKQTGTTVFGDFNNSAYGRTGALYESEGKICFCFKTASACFYVRNGSMTQARVSVGVSRIVDMRIFGPELYYVADYLSSKIIYTPGRNYTLPAMFQWTGAGLFKRDGEVWFIGEASGSGGTMCRPVSALASSVSGALFSGNDNFVYPFGDSIYAVGCGGGNLRVQDSEGQILYLRDSTYFFGNGCAAGIGDSFYVLVTPREEGAPPFVWHDGDQRIYDINGYLTGIEVLLSPPS